MGEAKRGRIRFTTSAEESPKADDGVVFTPPRQRTEREVPSSRQFTITRQCLKEVYAHAFAAYPSIACGIILTGEGNDYARPCANIQDKLHAQDPARFPADARTGFRMATEDINAINEEGRNNRWDMKAYYYSQDALKSVLTTLDRDNLKHWELWYPEVSLVILSLKERKVVDIAAYTWDMGKQDCIQLNVEIRDN